MRSSTIFIKCDPKAKGRPRFTKSGHTYTPDETRKYETFLKHELRKHKFYDFYNEPLIITIKFFLKTPQKMIRMYPCVRPDIDNLAKAILDAMNGIVYSDDKNIVGLMLSKRYHENPGIEVIITTKGESNESERTDPQPSKKA